MFLSPRAEIQAAWLPDTGCESCWHQKWPSGYISKPHSHPAGHWSDSWDTREITGHLPWASLLPLTHSIHHPQVGHKQYLLVSHITSFWKKKTWMAPTHPFTSPRGAGYYICSCGGGHGEAGAGSLLGIAQLLVITAAPTILAPLNSCLICVRLALEGLK